MSRNIQIVDLILKAKPAGLQITGANGSHAHEWIVWRDLTIPGGKVLIPGVIGGVDCGFGNSPVSGDVEPRVAWAKLSALVEGARLASERLWP